MAARNTLSQIKYSTQNVHKLKPGDGFTPQSMAMNSSQEIYVFCSGTSKNHVLKIDSHGNYTDIGMKDDYGHANGATHCPKNNCFYVTAYNYSSSSRSYNVYAVDSKTFKIKFTVTLDMTCTGIAYDKVTEQFYVSNRSGIGVYSYSSFSTGGKATRSRYITKLFDDGRAHQDVCGFNGIVMAVRSYEGSKDPNGKETAYVDLYDSGNGSYKGSWSFYSGELESLIIDSSGTVHLLTAWNRRYIKSDFKFSLKGSSGVSSPFTFTSKPSILPKWIDAMTTQFNWSKNQVYDFNMYPTVKNSQKEGTCITFPAVSLQRIGLLPEGGYFYFNPNTGRISGSPANYVIDHPETFTLSYPDKTIAELGDAIKKGDIVGYGEPAYHTQVFMGFNESGRPIFNTMGHYRALNTTSGYENRQINMLVHLNGLDGGTGTGLIAHPEKLYSSDNYEYLEVKKKEESKADIFAGEIKGLIDDLSKLDFTAIPDTPQNISKITKTSGATDKRKLEKTRVMGDVSGPPLPVALNPVEAPFVEVTIGGHKFGVFENNNRFDKYPNYIESLNVKKTNASMNEYTINLVHQVRPGGNPNFIDELLSKNGYDKITIRYGDANSNVEFIDSNALLIGASVSFDFTSSNIRYTLSTTSSAISIASHKRNFAKVVNKPSNVIRDLLYKDSNEDLLNAFPRMRDKNFVEKNNLIPTNDTTVEIEEFKDINVLTYVKNLVSSMKSDTDDIVNANYMLDFNNGYFSIDQVSTTYSYDSSLYEVNINYPDDNQVFSFNVDTNYSWPISYEYSGKVSNFNYEISDTGDINTYKTNSSQLLNFSNQMQMNVNDNWWKQVTEFPISAKLNCRGLLSPQLLLTYIKINCKYYGNDRITSGIYIVTGQEDTLGGSGYKTTLSLLRVAGYKEHLTISGRVKT